MEEVIEPVSKELIKAELTEDKRLRMTNKSNNQIYIITYQDSPNIMREIGRLREIAFRAAGGGTGLSMDIDEYDTMENPYKQLIVWNPEAEEILGGYRYILGTDVRFDEHGAPVLRKNSFPFPYKFSFQNVSIIFFLSKCDNCLAALIIIYISIKNCFSLRKIICLYFSTIFFPSSHTFNNLIFLCKCIDCR